MAEKKSKLVEIKTKPTGMDVALFIDNIGEEQKRKDCLILLEMMKHATGEEPVLWSNSIIGFGTMRYKSPNTGREVDWLKIGFSPRKANLSLNLSLKIAEHNGLLDKLGKHKRGVGCLYINKLEDINLDVLKEIVVSSVKARNSEA